MDRLAGLRRSMSPSPVKSLTVEGLAKNEGFDAFDESEDGLEELSSPKRQTLREDLVQEVDMSVLGEAVLGGALSKEELAMSVIKSCEERVGELHENRVVQDLFGKPASPQRLALSPKGGNPFDPWKEKTGNPFEDLVLNDEEGLNDGEVDASFLALRPD